MKRYKKYKDSGVQWIGEIPEEWEVKKLKYLVSNEKNSIKPGPFGSDLKSSDITLDGIKVYTQQNVIKKDSDLGEEFISVKKFSKLKSFLAKEGDFLLSTRGTIGKVYELPCNCEEGIIHPCLIKFTINNDLVVSKIIDYLFNECNIIRNQIRYMSNSTIIDVIYSDTLKNLIFPICSIEEQTQIVTYLDHKTSQLDALISKKEELIETLKASRTKLISETVTKGLDKDVEMKDSGVEWIGKIPKDYEIKKLKNICEYIGRGKSPEYEENTGLYTVNQACLYWNYFKKENIKSVSKRFYNNLSKDYILNKNDILINSTGGGNLGKSAFFDKTGTLGRVHFYEGDEGYAYDSHVTMIRLKEIYNKKYFYYMFCTKNVHSYIDLFCVNGSTKQIELSKIGLESILIPIPKIEEQHTIATYLDHKTSQIDNLISKIEEQITLLKKAKEKLITEVVTGKINVTDL